MKFKRTLSLLMGAALTAVSLFGITACGDDSGGGGGESGELVFWCNNGYLADFEERIAVFTEETGIKVKIEGIQANSWGELAQQISTSAYSGTLPDCGDLATEAMATLVAADMIVPIDEYLERDKAELAETVEQMAPILYNAHKYDGKMYSLPTIFNNVCIYYNKNVLRGAGIAETDSHYPHNGWTVEDFLYCCDKITANNVKGGANNKYGYKLQNQYFLTLEPWLNAFGTSVLSSDWKTATVNSAAAKSCFTTLYSMMNASDIKKQYSPAFGGTAEYDLFYSNRLGFMANGLPYVYNLYKGGFNGSASDVSKLKDGYGVVTFPSVDGSEKSIIGVGACPIFKTSNNKEAAWKLAKYLSSKKYQEQFLTENLWAVPVIKSAAEILETRDFFPDNGKIFYGSLENATIVPAPSAYSAVELELRKWFGGYMSNTNGFTLEGSGKNSLDSLATTINQYLGD